MQSFTAKYSDGIEEQVISDGKFLITIRHLPTETRANIEYKLAKSHARNKGAKITYLPGEEATVREVKHKPTKKLLREREIEIMGKKVRVKLNED